MIATHHTKFFRILFIKEQLINSVKLIALQHKMKKILSRLCLSLLAVMALQGCLKEEMVPVEITGYNHIKTESIYWFSVNGESGPNVSPYGGGSKFTCCVSLPLHWKPGLKATVHWQYGSGPNHTPPPPQSATVEIPQYTPDDMGTLQAHFYPDHQVILISSQYSLGHPENPLPKDKWAPWTIDEAWARNHEWFKQQQKTQEGKEQ